MKLLIKVGLGVAVMALALPALAQDASLNTTISSQLDFGDRGANVSVLQAFLANDSLVYPEGLITGYFGPLTRAAVMRFQAKYGIDQVGRVGPVTLAQLNSLIIARLEASDFSSPTMSSFGINVARTSATLSWMTNEPARGKVYYSTFPLFLYASAPTAVDLSLDNTNVVSLTGLSPNTTYYYARESTDAYGNISWTVKQSFKTLP